MNDMPMLTIVILNYNTRDLLEQSLSSILFHKKLQTIVVDNASQDDSVAMVKKKFPDVQIIVSKTNAGFTRGNNLARKKSLGKYVLFLNSDTKLNSDTLDVMVKFMEENPNVGISTALTNLPNGRLYYACHRGFPTPWNSFCYFLGLAKLFPSLKIFAGYTASYLPLDQIHEIDACSGTFLLIQKRLLDQINWFDEDYFSYGEDIEMCYQVKSLGYKVMFYPFTSLTHYWGASSGLKSTSKDVSKASRETREKWNRARYDAMRIFYDKHFRANYPEIIRQAILAAIKFTMYLRHFSD